MSDPAFPHDHAALHDGARGDALSAALAALRGAGERVTAPRRAVLTVLADRSEHLTADEVAALLADSDVHRATVYRTLDLLTAAGVVSRQHSGSGPARYHLATTAHGHEHLHGHCARCGEVVGIPADAFDAATRAIAEATGFALDATQSTFVGTCRRCAASA